MASNWYHPTNCQREIYKWEPVRVFMFVFWVVGLFVCCLFLFFFYLLSSLSLWSSSCLNKIHHYCGCTEAAGSSGMEEDVWLVKVRCAFCWNGGNDLQSNKSCVCPIHLRPPLMALPRVKGCFYLFIFSWPPSGFNLRNYFMIKIMHRN